MKRLVIFLLLVNLIAGLTFAQAESEPNDPNSALKFERSQERQSWTIKDESSKEQSYFDNPGSDMPTYVTQVILSKDAIWLRGSRTVVEAIQASPLAKKLSKAQQEFLKTGFAAWADDENVRVCPYYHCFPNWLYAKSEADAKIMTEAFLDGLSRFARNNTAEYEQRLAQEQEKINTWQKALPKKEDQLKACIDLYGPVKKDRHEFEGDAEAKENAKQTMQEMDKTLDSLEVELTGIREKLATIEKFRQGKDKEQLSDQVRLKLDQMYIEQMIELSGLEARRRTAENIRAKEQRFLALLTERDQLEQEVKTHKSWIESAQDRITKIQEWLENPSYGMLPPKVYQNKIIIHRIEGSTAPEDVEDYVKRVEELFAGGANIRVDSFLHSAEKYLQMVAEGHLLIEQSILNRLKNIEKKLQEMTVDQLLAGVESLDWDGMTEQYFLGYGRHYLDELQEAKDCLLKEEQNKYHLKDLQVQRLRNFVKHFEQLQQRQTIKVDEFLTTVESIDWDGMSIGEFREYVAAKMPDYLDYAEEALNTADQGLFHLEAPQAKRLRAFVNKFSRLKNNLRR